MMHSEFGRSFIFSNEESGNWQRRLGGAAIATVTEYSTPESRRRVLSVPIVVERDLIGKARTTFTLVVPKGVLARDDMAI